MNGNTPRPNSTLSSPWLFFAAAFGWTWLFWLAGIALGMSAESGGALLVMLLGVSGPGIAGIVFTYLTEGKEGRREYWRRVISFQRIPLVWYPVILLFALGLSLLASLLDILLGGAAPTWSEAALGFVSDPLSVFMSILFVTLIPFLEELGWRYSLDRLQSTRSALRSSLILGVLWAIWHAPLFLVEGTYQASLGLWSLEFWLYMLGIVPLTFVATWIYNNTRSSILAVILFHAAVNFSGELLTITRRADLIFTGLWFVAAMIIVIIWGGDTMTGRSGTGLESSRGLRITGD